ncbi:hypothetical protein [Bartonella florencae]|uniref:hypothetical protein n=1 Tax=Bartonella florencae TaxID=928210 RepID=UPI0005558A1E|nr:hypothetical protein [Bartonella florencae]
MKHLNMEVVETLAVGKKNDDSGSDFISIKMLLLDRFCFIPFMDSFVKENGKGREAFLSKMP